MYKKLFSLSLVSLISFSLFASESSLNEFKGKTFEGSVDIVEFIEGEHGNHGYDQSGLCTISFSESGQVYYAASESRNMGVSLVYGGEPAREFERKMKKEVTIFELDQPARKGYYNINEENLKIRVKEGLIDSFEFSEFDGHYASDFRWDFRRRVDSKLVYRCTDLRQVQ